ncbi:hypothetical protein [Streptomyces sp. NPDC008317]|uniref:hypothetical protein n=1 Tax=Streptomyces sp. NPDC008317 TaxID=3364827 RepID=UPI0036E781C8
MSGPMSLLSRVAGGGMAALPELPRPRRVPSWAVGDPVAELAERLSAACSAAVHPDEIAAVLESEGLTDEQITGRYGHPDLFSLARELFETVPRRFPEPEPADDPWQVDVWRCVLRGLTFALPGVAYVLGGRWAGGDDGPFGVSRAVAAWGAAALCGWGWNQALAHRAHLHLLAQRPRAAARCLVTGAAVGDCLAGAAAAAVAGPGHLSALAFAAGQSVYVASATVLLVLGRERSLLYVLTPLAVAVACGAGGLPSPAVAAVLVATAAAAGGAALATALRTALTGEPPERGPAKPPRAPWRERVRADRGAQLRARASRFGRRAAGPGTGTRTTPGRFGRRAAGPGTGTPTAPGRFGRRAAGPGTDTRTTPGRFGRRAAGPGTGTRTGLVSSLRTLPEAARLLWRADDGVTDAKGLSPYLSLPHGMAGLAGGALVVAAALTGEFVAALTVSMGVAEWLLFRFRSRCLTALRGTTVHERLLARSWRVLAGCLALYAVALAALAAVEAAVVPGAAAWNPAHLSVLLALGGTLWLSLLLQSCGRAWTGSYVLAAAVLTAVVLLAAHTATAGTVLGLVCAGAAAVLLTAAFTMTGRVTTHR